mmetsp:Transcript_7947/g.14160  ORF Transcript_7947/g.14160 Transcript_7947/m.14160 type:complete len:105 (-) Transcript_7947:1668-1982(-)
MDYTVFVSLCLKNLFAQIVTEISILLLPLGTTQHSCTPLHPCTMDLFFSNHLITEGHLYALKKSKQCTSQEGYFETNTRNTGIWLPMCHHENILVLSLMQCAHR